MYVLWESWPELGMNVEISLTIAGPAAARPMNIGSLRKFWLYS